MVYLIKDRNYLFNLASEISHVDSIADYQKDLDIISTAPLVAPEAFPQINPNIKSVFASL